LETLFVLYSNSETVFSCFLSTNTKVIREIKAIVLSCELPIIKKEDMKNKIFAVILILLSVISNAQEGELISKKSILLGLTFSPDYCYRSLRYNSSDEDFANYRNEIEIPKFGFTTGINAVFMFNKSIAMELGLHFSDKGQQTKKIEISQEDPDQTLPDEIHNTWHYYYIDIPVKLNYFIIKGNLKLFVSPGISGNIFLKQKRVKREFNPDNEFTYFTTEGFSKLNIAVILGAGLDYSITKKLSLRFEPIFRYALTPLDDFEIKRYPYSMGANFGFYYKLKK